MSVRCSAACGWCGACSGDYRMPPCSTKGCHNRVSFPHETFCNRCTIENEILARKREREVQEQR